MTALRALRVRLLWQYLLTVGLLLAGAEAALYGLFCWAGERELDTELRKEVERIASAVEVDPKGKAKVKGKKELSRKPMATRAVDWEVRGDDGGVLARAEAGPGQRLPGLGASDPSPDLLRLGDAEHPSVGRVRAARLRTARQNKDKGKQSARGVTRTFDIRVVVDRGPTDEQAARLAAYLVAGFPVLFGLCWVGGVYLIRGAVRPVEEAFRRERRFTGAVSHELRTPLTALRGEIDVTLRRPREPAEYEQALGRMSALVGRMTDLVEGMLVLARAEAGHLLHGAGEVPLGSFRQTLEEVVRLLPGRERVALHADLPEGGAFVGDGLLLTLAVRNLIENALVHAAAGPVDVGLTADRDGVLRVTVTDHGPGPPDERLAQAQPGGRRPGGGGLGLSIARAIVEAHGGSLRLAKGAAGGCEATLTLRLAVTGDRQVARTEADAGVGS